MKWKFQPNIAGKTLLIVTGFLLFYILLKKRKALFPLFKKSIRYLQMKTWDFISDQRIAQLHPKVQAKAKEFIIRAEKELGIKLRVVSGLRTMKEQAALFAQGRTKPGKIVTHAKPGQSLHNHGLAIDVVEIKNGKALWNNSNWSKIGRLGKSLGFIWGGDWRFKDLPHFEVNPN